MNRKDEILNEVLNVFRTIVICFVTVFMCTTFLVRPIIIDGTSMNPTLHDRDFGFSFVLGALFKSYDRFDVVVIYYPQDNKYLVKRIIGLPGETVQYRDDTLYIDGNEVEENFFDSNWVDMNTFGGRISFTDDMEKPVRLKDDEYFVVGDNRPNSLDSRSLGPIKRSQIKSKYAFIVWPLESFNFVCSGN